MNASSNECCPKCGSPYMSLKPGESPANRYCYTCASVAGSANPANAAEPIGDLELQPADEPAPRPSGRIPQVAPSLGGRGRRTSVVPGVQAGQRPQSGPVVQHSAAPRQSGSSRSRIQAYTPDIPQIAPSAGAPGSSARMLAAKRASSPLAPIVLGCAALGLVAVLYFVFRGGKQEPAVTASSDPMPPAAAKSTENSNSAKGAVNSAATKNSATNSAAAKTAPASSAAPKVAAKVETKPAVTPAAQKNIASGTDNTARIGVAPKPDTKTAPPVANADPAPPKANTDLSDILGTSPKKRPKTEEEENAASKPVVVSPAERAASDAKVQEGLDKKVTFDVTAKPLSEVLDYLRQQAGVPIALDPKSADKGKTPITMGFNELEIDKVLRMVLSAAELEFKIQDRAVLCYKPSTEVAQVEAPVEKKPDGPPELDENGKPKVKKSLVDAVGDIGTAKKTEDKPPENPFKPKGPVAVTAAELTVLPVEIERIGGNDKTMTEQLAKFLPNWRIRDAQFENSKIGIKYQGREDAIQLNPVNDVVPAKVAATVEIPKKYASLRPTLLFEVSAPPSKDWLLGVKVENFEMLPKTHVKLNKDEPWQTVAVDLSRLADKHFDVEIDVYWAVKKAKTPKDELGYVRNVRIEWIGKPKDAPAPKADAKPDAKPDAGAKPSIPANK